MRTVALLSFLAALAASSPIPRSGALVARDPPASDGVSTLDIINKWRGAYGLNALAWDDGVRPPLYLLKAPQVANTSLSSPPKPNKSASTTEAWA